MSTQRTTYLIAYDIADHKRLARVHKVVEGFAIGGQKSLYEC
ncbi:CRISPR-associated endonuclease Cas2 [Conservatibacter flavescens]|nr:CRISPR-associated endonuclease Cas2 [Conservatibacter flavescens]